jgi:tetratricopeptide (TPR) repeat protein
MIESFQFGPEVLAVAQKAVAADPDFAFGHYLVATFTPPPQQGGNPKPHMDKALELAKRASDGERRYLEAVSLVRAQKPAEALPILKQLAQDYPGERLVRMMLGQVLLNQGKSRRSAPQFRESHPDRQQHPARLQLSRQLPSAQGRLREGARDVPQRAAEENERDGSLRAELRFGLHLRLRGQHPEALKVLNAFQEEYSRTSGAAEFPPVFIWNSIARLLLENGQPEEALKAYEKGYQTVPGSKLPPEEKMIWQGRLHHGRGRALAKLGKHEEAWKEAELIKKMIDENGERGKRFMPSFHYIAGYLKLEGGDYAKAIEHLKQADLTDLFHKLLLARAYDRSGDAVNAQKLYREIVESKQVNLERALAVPEAQKKLKG